MKTPNLAWNVLRTGYIFVRNAASKLVGSLRSGNSSSFPVLHDVFQRNASADGRALLVYRVDPFLDDGRAAHQNAEQNIDIARSLDAHGYVVDVANWNDLTVEPERAYDLLIGVGIGTERLAKSMPETITKVYIGTGTDPSFNNQAEWNRIQRVQERKGCQLQPRRLAKFRSASLQYFDAIAGFGNAFTEQTYSPHFGGPIYLFRNYGQLGVPATTQRNESARRHFLYMASGGQVHKGLDLLLDVFSDQPDLHLHVCGPLLQEGDFLRCYWRELFTLDNIHPVGWVNIQGEAFERLASRCAYVIVPSCAEAQIGSVVSCMHAGLIPIVTPACGLDVQEEGMLLSDDSIDTIASTARRLADQPLDTVNAHSKQVLDIARTEYNRDSFKDRWNEIAHTITEDL